jgi:hypothetical protein
MESLEVMLRLDLRKEEGPNDEAGHGPANYRVNTGPD